MNYLKKSFTGNYKAKYADKHIQYLKDDYEKILREQKKRIFHLREQNHQLSLVVKDYKENEKYIIGAISQAQEEAQSIIRRADKEAKKRLLIVKYKENQLNRVISGYYEKLYELKVKSESIYKAVSKAITEKTDNDSTKIIRVQ